MYKKKEKKPKVKKVNWNPDPITSLTGGASRNFDGKVCPACGFANEKKIKVCDRCNKVF